jgi:iron complex transport system substrate-binding protein
VKRLAAALLLVTALVALAACGGGSDPKSGSSAPSSTASTGADAGPVTIRHRYGTTTVPETPKRIVSLDNLWTDVLTAMDAPMVGAGLDPSAKDGRWPWQDDIPTSVQGVEITDTNIPYERVAALKPDLIVITFFAQKQADYDRLSQIAPTIPSLSSAEVDKWQDIATAAGKVLHEPARAEALIDEADQRDAALAQELPGLKGKTFTLANYVPGDAIYVVADPDDGASTFFRSLGMKLDPDILAAADGESGRVKLSLERVDELDADLLVILTNGANPDDIPGYRNLPAVRSGAVAELDLAPISGLNTPSPRSLPYSIAAIKPALEAAAR